MSQLMEIMPYGELIDLLGMFCGFLLTNSKQIKTNKKYTITNQTKNIKRKPNTRTKTSNKHKKQPNKPIDLIKTLQTPKKHADL